MKEEIKKEAQEAADEWWINTPSSKVIAVAKRDIYRAGYLACAEKQSAEIELLRAENEQKIIAFGNWLRSDYRYEAPAFTSELYAQFLSALNP